MKRKFSIWSLVFGTFMLGTLHCFATGTAGRSQGILATKESRRSVVYTEAGEITALDVSNGEKDFGSYHLEFFTLDTGSLLLPVLLHADMIFYVHTGRGTISWIDKNKVEALQVGPGDMYRLEEGTAFYIQSSADPNREKLRIHAIFNTCADDENPIEFFTGGAYSNIAELVRGFDMEVLQMSFGVSVEVIEEIKRTEKPPLIIPFEVKTESESHNRDWREGIFEAVLGMRTVDVLNGNNDKKAFNIFKRKPDVENSHGQSIALTQKDEKSLNGSSMGVFMVNLTKGSMVGPHWNPKAMEIAIVIKGHGIVQVICPSNPSDFGKFKTKRLYVKEGDVFIIPKFYPMAQMSFIDSSFVFVGFSNNGKKNHPQILAGKRSVIQVIDREIMAASFNVTSEAFGHLLTKQEDAVLLGCEGCAEEVKKKLEEEVEREEKEQERRRKEGEEEAKRREEEEEARRHEEEVRRRDEEEKRREEDARRKEEEEEKKREEERKAKEAQRREEEEEAQRRQEEEEAQRKEEEREMRKREEEEEAQRKWKEDDQRAREKREQEEEVQRRKREEEAQREWERRKEEEEVCEEERRKEKHRGDVMRKCEEEKDEAQRKGEEREEEDERKREEEGEIERGKVKRSEM